MAETRGCQVTLYHPELEYTEDAEKTYEVVPAKFHRWADDVYRGELNIRRRTMKILNGVADVGLILESSTNLVDWVPTSKTNTVSVPADADIKFFRYRKD